MSLSTIRTNLKAALATTGIDRVYREETDKIEAPALVILNPDLVYDDDFDGNVTYLFPVTLITGRQAGVEIAIPKLDELLDPANVKSVTRAIRADSRLGGACASARVLRGSWGQTTWNDISYVGITFEIEVMT